MKRGSTFGIITAAVGAVVLGVTSPARATNLLQNGNFESPPDPGNSVDSLATGWSFVFDCQRANFHDHTTGSGYSIWAKTFEPLGGGITQNFSNGFTVGSTYNLTSQVFFEGAYPTTSAQILVALDWMDAGGNLVGTPAVNTINPTDGDVITNAWSPFTISGVAPTGATQVQVSLGWSGGGTVTGSQSVFFDDVDLEGAGAPPPPPTPSWFVDASGDWNLASHWATASVPNGVGAEADLLDKITANRTVFTDTGITLGTLTFNNSHTYEVTGVGSLTLQAASGNAFVNVQQGTQEINLPTIIASSTTLNVSPGATLIIADPITVNAGKTLTQTGGGNVTFQSIISVLGGAGVAFANSTHAHELDVAATGTASIGGSGSTVTVDVLNNGGKIDVKSNKLIVSYGTGADPASTVQMQLTTGYAGGAWTGNGINSSSATSKIGVGWKDDTSAKAVTVRSTYYGDTNLDGVVNTSDFTNLSQHFGAPSASAIWANGDFNYDGKVNALDFNALATNFGAAALPDVALGTLVPEPTSALLLISIGAMLSERRRRNGA